MSFVYFNLYRFAIEHTLNIISLWTITINKKASPSVSSFCVNLISTENKQLPCLTPESISKIVHVRFSPGV